jgi:acetyltransferase-like isoleucine patch superfamily enzyme
MLLTAEHDVNSVSFEGVERPIVIHDRCWIASRAILLPGAEVDEGVVVGAGAVLRGRVPAWTVVVGVPAKPVARRNPEAQETLPISYHRFMH